MEVYKVEKRDVQVLDKVVCDWCGGDASDDLPDEYNEHIDVEYRKNYDAWGDHFTEEGSWKVDLCRDCMEKLKNYLIQQGANIQDISY